MRQEGGRHQRNHDGQDEQACGEGGSESRERIPSSAALPRGVDDTVEDVAGELRRVAFSPPCLPARRQRRSDLYLVPRPHGELKGRLGRLW